MTPEKLKQLIIETMNEVYKISRRDKYDLKKKGYTDRDDAWLRRQMGLQYDKEVQRDITNLRQYNQTNNSTPQGQEMIKAFQNASGVTIAHGLGYISYAESELGGKGDENRKKSCFSFAINVCKSFSFFLLTGSILSYKYNVFFSGFNNSNSGSPLEVYPKLLQFFKPYLLIHSLKSLIQTQRGASLPLQLLFQPLIGQ